MADTLHRLHTTWSVCVSILTLLILLKHGAVLQRLGGRAVLQDVAIETSELLSRVLGTPPSRATILHGKQLGAEVVEPQHVGVGVVLSPVVSEMDKNEQRKINESSDMISLRCWCESVNELDYNP